MRIGWLCGLVLVPCVLLTVACSDSSTAVTIVNDSFERVTVDRCTKGCATSAGSSDLAPKETVRVDVPSSGEIVWYVVWDANDQILGCLAVSASTEKKQNLYPVSFRVDCP